MTGKPSDSSRKVTILFERIYSHNDDDDNQVYIMMPSLNNDNNR